MQQKKSLTLTNAIDLFFIALFSLYYLLPSYQNSMSFMMILMLELVYVAYTCLNTPQPVVQKILKCILLIVFITICYYLLTTTATISKSVSAYNLKRFLSKFNQLLSSFLPVLLLLRIQKKCTKNQRKLILFLSLIIFSYVLINSYNELQINETAARSWAEFEEQAEDNIATYSYVYAASAIIPVIFMCMMKTKHIVGKLVCILVMIGLFAFLISAQYTLALLIPVICCAVFWFLNPNYSFAKAIVVLCLPIFLIALPYIFEFLANHMWIEDIRIRFIELSHFFSGSLNLTYDLKDRLEKYGACLQAFAQSPLIGKTVKIDGHATFLTVLCDIGLVGSVPFYYLYFSMRNNIYQLIGCENNKLLFFPTFLALILMGFVNPIHSTPTLAYVVWFLVPLIIIVLRENNFVFKAE